MISPITNLQGAYSLAGKNAIITGGNRGIGFGISSAMAQAGANIAILCRDKEKAKEAIAQLQAFGGRYESFHCDVTDIKSVRQAVAAVYEAFGQIDILVNNAGVAAAGPFLDMDEELSDWHRVMNTDLYGMVYMTYEVGKRMRDAKKGGSIINITSNAGFMVNRGVPFTAYSTSKAAGNHFTHCMASELGQYDIRVNGIAPGYTHSDFSKDMTQEIQDNLTSQQPLKRFGEAIEVGALAVYLASPAAAQVTGVVVPIDGGYMLIC